MLMKLLRTQWHALALGIALAVALVSLALTRGKLDDARKDNARLIAEAALKDTLIATQNDAVDALAKQREADRKAYLAGLQAANKQAIRLEVDAAKLLELPTPADPAEACRAAEALLRKELVQ